jgi:hypothetical protein
MNIRLDGLNSNYARQRWDVFVRLAAGLASVFAGASGNWGAEFGLRSGAGRHSERQPAGFCFASSSAAWLSTSSATVDDRRICVPPLSALVTFGAMPAEKAVANFLWGTCAAIANGA